MFGQALNRFPIKHGWDALALAQILLRGDVEHSIPLSLREKMACLNFYFTTGNIRNLFVAPSRSGSRWSELGLSLALDLARGGSGDYTYENDDFYPERGRICQRLDWRVPTKLWEREHFRVDGPVYDKEQLFLVFRKPYFQLRAAPIRQMKLIIVTRPIPEIIESKFLKFIEAGKRTGGIPADPADFDFDARTSELIDFFNSWGDVTRWHPSALCLKFDDLHADPVSGHKEILDFWGVKIPTECVDEGFKRASKKAMLEKIPKAARKTNLRVSTRGDKRGTALSLEQRHQVSRLVRQSLAYDFGHEHHFHMNIPEFQNE